MNIRIPEKANYVIEQLERAGHEAYIVGGCVRDALLQREPEDWDITTSASPFQVKNIFPKTIDTGIQHGTVTVMVGREGFEVTTYRIDGEYEDARHPKSVNFTSCLAEDLKRRDFTINAMAYNPRIGIVDEFGGRRDLEKGIIRCVGCASGRFEEDALRILRAIRFSAQLGFVIEEETKQAITALAPNLSKISEERIQTELNKLLISDHPEEIRTAFCLGITAVILPEFDQIMGIKDSCRCYTVGDQTVAMLKEISADKVLRWAALLHDIGRSRTYAGAVKEHLYDPDQLSADLAKKILKRLKFDNTTINKVSKLIAFHSCCLSREKKEIRRCMNRIGEELFDSLMEVMRADIQTNIDCKGKLEELEAVRLLHEEILADNECFTMKALNVNGKDLMAAGMKPGKEIGELLTQMLDYVIEHPKANEKAKLMEVFHSQINGGNENEG